MNTAIKRLIALVASLGMLMSTLSGVANAAMVGTQSALAVEQRAEQVAEIQDWLARDGVKQQLTRMGVDPAAASERVAALTGEELRLLHQRIGDMPAGAGIAELVGVVFIVFILLELLGVTNVFTKF